MVASESGSSLKLRKHGRPLTRPKIREQANTLIAEGLTDTEVGRRIGVSRQAVTAYKKNHPDGVAAVVAEVERQVTDYHIAQKVNRIAAGDFRRQLIERVREDRANGGTGMDTGIVARTYKQIGSGKNTQLVEEYKVDTAFLAEWRANERQVSEELGQLPRPSDQTINVNVGVAVSLAWSDGAEA